MIKIVVCLVLFSTSLSLSSPYTHSTRIINTTLTFPKWTAPRGDPSLPLGGWKRVPEATYVNIYNATADFGTYNHAAMITFGSEEKDPQPLFTISWKNSPKDEDSPGQRIVYSQSYDGIVWTATNTGNNILFPNMSTTSNPAALFAGPFIWLNGHLYASASPKQFCLFPDQYQDVLLLRRVLTNSTGSFGPVFWATYPPPSQFSEASMINGVLNLTEVDSITKEDVALLTPLADETPCIVPMPMNTTAKCEACSGGCQLWTDAGKVGNERTHYTIPGSPNGQDSYNDVILYRTSNNILTASVRSAPGQGSWSSPSQDTNIPNDNSNINTGPLPDGRRYLLSNAMPYTIRDPLTVALTTDGFDWNTCAVAMTCTDLPGDGCGPRYPGKYKNPGPSYPQGVVAFDSLFVVATNNKENVWVGKLPLSQL
jgi:hypothetical protein